MSYPQPHPKVYHQLTPSPPWKAPGQTGTENVQNKSKAIDSLQRPERIMGRAIRPPKVGSTYVPLQIGAEQTLGSKLAPTSPPTKRAGPWKETPGATVSDPLAAMAPPAVAKYSKTRTQPAIPPNRRSPKAPTGVLRAAILQNRQLRILRNPRNRKPGCSQHSLSGLSKKT